MVFYDFSFIFDKPVIYSLPGFNKDAYDAWFIEEDPRLNSVECPAAETEPETAKCQYCGGEFVVGLHTTCPHCGAPIENWD